MPNYNFTLILDRTANSHLDALHEAGCDDATFGSVDGVYYADFFREAPTLVDAIYSAIAAVESIPDFHVMYISLDLPTMAEIAERLGRTRESVRLLVAGERGTGDFPAPASHLRSHHRLWRWSDVAAWAGIDQGILPPSVKVSTKPA